MKFTAVDQGDVRYTVRVGVDKERIKTDLAAMWHWFERQHLTPPAFRHSIEPQFVSVQVGFDTLAKAVDFADAFGGVILQASYTAALASDLVDCCDEIDRIDGGDRA